MIKSDKWIRRMSREHNLIHPFTERQTHIDHMPAISFGLSSYGYDVRVDGRFKVFTNTFTARVDPKNFDERVFVDMRVERGQPCFLPPNSFALAQTVERFKIPRNVLALCVGKSTYARCGILLNTTPFEPCLAEDSEALTIDGWAPIADVKVGDQLLTRREDGVAEYRVVEKKQERDFQGEMMHFDGRSVDQLVTPDHKLPVWFRNCQKNSYNFKLIEARDVFGKDNYSFDREVIWEGVDNTSGIVDINGEKYPLTTFLRFLGCWLGDGSAYVGTDGGYHVKLAVVTKERKREYFRGVLEDMGVKFSLQERGFHFFSKPLVQYLRQFGHAADKYVDRQWMSLPAKQLSLLLEGLMASDGTHSTGTYTTVSRRLADDVQEIIYKTGAAAIVRLAEDGFDPAYKIRISDDHMTPKMAPRNHKLVAYSGKVYDVTVPNHVFFMRRNGKASWTGNCWEGVVTLEISNTTPLPAAIYAGEGIAQVLFFESDEPCETSYADRHGNYQGQTGLMLPRVG